jgi:hypothetical protein
VPNVILKGVDPDDFILATRAARWMLAQPHSQKDGIIAYGEGETKDFYVKRNKASVTVRPIQRSE